MKIWQEKTTAEAGVINYREDNISAPIAGWSLRPGYAQDQTFYQDQEGTAVHGVDGWERNAKQI